MPIQAADARDIARYGLKPTHTKHNGDQIYASQFVQNEDDGDSRTSTYFYRAMTLAEFDSYRNSFTFLQVNGHQGWAPYRSYSAGYLNGEQSRLVEVQLVGFQFALQQEGWFQGKSESGCTSWGIGIAQSNGWRGGTGVRSKNKHDALHPHEIFHNCLNRAHVRLVTLHAAMQ